MRKLLIFGAAVAFTALAAPAGAANFCTGLAEAVCPDTAGCAWKPAETWTRSEDSKVRVKAAGCKFDAKAAREALGRIAAKS